jgi:Tol biopolymer transport system component
MKSCFAGVLASLAFLVAGCSGSAEMQPGAGSGSSALGNQCEQLDSMPSGAIVFSRYDDDGSGIYLMDPDGSNIRCLVDTPGEDTYPMWSPDGAMIAFASDLDGDSDLYVVDADGGGLVRVTNRAVNEYRPVWSPDGLQIAYSTSESEDGPFSVDVVDRDGSNHRTLVWTGHRFRYVELAAWSPDGGTLVIGADGGALDTEGSGYDLFTLSPSGTDMSLLAGGPGDFGGGATFSPDGSRLVFQADLEGGCIYTMNADGTGLERITSGCAEGFELTWSPDGTRIAFAGGPHGPADAYVMNADGTNRVLIDDAGDAAFLDWQPV